MFEIHKTDENILNEILLTSLNNLFETLKKTPLKSLSDIIDQMVLLNICNELDENLFSDCNFLGEKSSGIFYSEMKEIHSKIICYLRKAGLNLREEFKNLERLNISQLILFQKEENLKLIELIFLFACNSANKSEIIDTISTFEEYICTEILKIIENYINMDEEVRISFPVKRESINLEQEIAMRYLNKLELMGKEKEKLEDELSKLKLKLNNLELDFENAEKDNKHFLEKIASLEEQNKKFEIENRELKKLNIDLDVQLKRINQINKDNSLIEKYRIKLDEKELELSQNINKLKELEQKNSNDRKMYEENIYQLKNTIFSLSDFKEKYEKIAEKLKEQQNNTEKLALLETTYKDYASLTKKYNALVLENQNLQNEKEKVDILLIELEEKLEQNNKNLELFKSKAEENSFFQNIIKENLNKNTTNNKHKNHLSAETGKVNIGLGKTEEDNSLHNFSNQNIKISNFHELENHIENKQYPTNQMTKEINQAKLVLEENEMFKTVIQKKDFEISELNSIIKILEEKQNEVNSQNEEKINEIETLKKTLSLKQDTIKELNENICAMNEKIDLLESEMINLNNRITYENNKKLEEFDLIKKENIETKDKYEKEFELIASSIYNLGVNYWSMKLSTSNEINEKPSWLKRERRKYYDGDL